MCEECGSIFNHLPGCPNAPEPEPLFDCYACDCGICPGDRYFQIDGYVYCKDCMEKFQRTAGEDE